MVSDIKFKTEPKWYGLGKAVGLFLASYAAVETGHVWVVESLSPSFSYYVVVLVIGGLLWSAATIRERQWNRNPGSGN